MRQFLDLPGQSGSNYRFRVSPENQAHRPIAGNYVLVRESDKGLQVVRIGTTNDLSRVRASLTRAQLGADTHLFTRLNVSRAVRDAEHEDLVAEHPKARVDRLEVR